MMESLSFEVWKIWIKIPGPSSFLGLLSKIKGEIPDP
jgi:hypothetical protein